MLAHRGLACFRNSTAGRGRTAAVCRPVQHFPVASDLHSTSHFRPAPSVMHPLFITMGTLHSSKPLTTVAGALDGLALQRQRTSGARQQAAGTQYFRSAPYVGGRLEAAHAPAAHVYALAILVRGERPDQPTLRRPLLEVIGSCIGAAEIVNLPSCRPSPASNTFLAWHRTSVG